MIRGSFVEVASDRRRGQSARRCGTPAQPGRRVAIYPNGGSLQATSKCGPELRSYSLTEPCQCPDPGSHFAQAVAVDPYLYGAGLRVGRLEVSRAMMRCSTSTPAAIRSSPRV